MTDQPTPARIADIRKLLAVQQRAEAALNDAQAHPPSPDEYRVITNSVMALRAIEDNAVEIVGVLLAALDASAAERERLTQEASSVQQQSFEEGRDAEAEIWVAALTEVGIDFDPKDCIDYEWAARQVAQIVRQRDEAEATLARVRALRDERRKIARDQRDFAESKDCVVPATLRAQADANEAFADDLAAALSVPPPTQEGQ